MTSFAKHHQIEERKEEWLTPPSIIEALKPFDLDPCASSSPPWPTARFYYSESGLDKPWFGRVWLNPPYNEINKWMAKMAKYNNGVALTYARTDTQWFHDYVWQRALAILFVKGRLFFHHIDGTRADSNAGAPSVLIAYGPNNLLSLINSNIEGTICYF